jgi:hypothetical protein
MPVTVSKARVNYPVPVALGLLGRLHDLIGQSLGSWAFRRKLIFSNFAILQLPSILESTWARVVTDEGKARFPPSSMTRMPIDYESRSRSGMA